MSTPAYLRRWIETLKGGKIAGIYLDAGVPVLIVEDKNGRTRYVFIQRDAEGNGPGWLEIIS